MMELETGKTPYYLGSRSERESGGRSQWGFTLIEMTMATVLFAIVLGAMLSVLEVGRKTRLNTLERGEDTQDVRIALNQMSTDVLNAGVDFPNQGPLIPTNWLFNHLALAPSTPTNSQDNLPPVIPGPSPLPLSFTGTAPSNSTLTCTICNPTSTSIADQVTLASVNYLVDCGQQLAMSGPNTASTASQTASMVVTGPSPGANGPISGCTPTPVVNVGDILWLWSEVNQTGTIAMITSLSKTNVANDTINFAGTDPLGLNSFSATTGNVDIYTLINNANNSSNPPIAAYKLDFVTYYVKDDGSGRGTGTLMRRVYGGSSGGVAQAFTDEPLAFDVVNMTINYVLANSPDGTSSTTTTTENPSLAQYQNIRQLIVKVTVQTPSGVQVTNQAAYNGVHATPTPTVNPYVQETLTAVMNTRNLGYEKSVVP